MTEKKSLFSRLREGLFKSREHMSVAMEAAVQDDRPIDEHCDCPACRHYSRAYIRHLFKAKEMLAGRLAVMHNLYFYNTLAERIRSAIETDTFAQFRAEYSGRLAKLIR